MIKVIIGIIIIVILLFIYCSIKLASISDDITGNRD